MFREEAVLELGRYLIAEDRSAEAIELLCDALCAGIPAVGTPLGRHLERLGRYEQAEAVYGAAVDLGDGHAAFNLALMKEEGGDMVAAKSWARRAAALGDGRARRWLSSEKRIERRVKKRG